MESKINVSINEDKIEALNQKLLSQANGSLASAKGHFGTKINQAEAQLSLRRRQATRQSDGAYDQLAL